MKVILLGYGKMGKAIEQAIHRSGVPVTILHTFSRSNMDAVTVASLSEADLVIEFTTPLTAAQHIRMCIDAGVPVISGTTGWYEHYPEIAAYCMQKNGAMLCATNFSIGVHIFLAVNARLAEIMQHQKQYEVRIEETHHTQKLDAPSGTALALADSINEAMNNQYHYIYDRSQRREMRDDKEIGISAVRGGTIVGEHEVIFAGPDEVIEFKHTAYSKAVFGKGAVEAAKFLAGKPAGRYDMSDVISAK